MSVRTIEEADRSETDPEDDPTSTGAHILDVKDYEAIFMPNRSCKFVFICNLFCGLCQLFSVCCECSVYCSVKGIIA